MLDTTYSDTLECVAPRNGSRYVSWVLDFEKHQEEETKSLTSHDVLQSINLDTPG